MKININHLKKVKRHTKRMDYERGKIYKLRCNKTGLEYIHMTKQNEPQVKFQLKKKYKTWLKTKDEKHREPFFTILENDDWKYEIVEEYPCNSLEELRNRLQHWHQQGKYINTIEYPINYEEKVECEICGDEYIRKNHNRHVISKNHLEWLNKGKEYEGAEERMIAKMGCFRNEDGYICSLNEDGSITNYGCKSVFG